MKIETTTTPSKHDAKIISEGIVDFNTASVPNLESIEDEVKFCVFARDNEDNIVGGIRANCFWNTLHIELLWLAEEIRGKGTGKDLIQQAERFAKQNNCEKVFVETTSWQAKPFYERCGYKLIATLPDRPKGYASYYLTKDL